MEEELAAGIWHMDAARLPPGRLRLACTLTAEPAWAMRMRRKRRACKDAIIAACEAAGAGGELYDVLGLVEDVIQTWTGERVRAAAPAQQPTGLWEQSTRS